MGAAGGDGDGALASPNELVGCPLNADSTGDPSVWTEEVAETLLGGACPVPGVGAGTKTRRRGGGTPGEARLGRGPVLGCPRGLSLVPDLKGRE